MEPTLRNQSRNAVVADRVLVADRFGLRLRGMIGRDFTAFDAMVFPDCASVHTFWMKMPIDLIYLDSDDQVLGCEQAARPWRAFFGPRGTKTIIELAAKALDGRVVEAGDQLSWKSS
jgi:uncharacterized membrane protein (UPF0127 family)